MKNLPSTFKFFSIKKTKPKNNKNSCIPWENQQKLMNKNNKKRQIMQQQQNIEGQIIYT